MARQPFKAVPLRPVRNRPRRPPPGARWFVPALAALPLAAFTAIVLWPGPRSSEAFERPRAPDREAARFEICSGGVRIDCVVDGDTFWYRGEKIRIADINTPETSEPECAEEARLGRRATLRLQALLTAGPVTLEARGRDRDTYGRLLRTVTRGGESLGLELVDEGLAEEWQGYRGSWC